MWDQNGGVGGNRLVCMTFNKWVKVKLHYSLLLETFLHSTFKFDTVGK